MALNFDTLFNIVAKVKGSAEVDKFAGKLKGLAGSALGVGTALSGLAGVLTVGTLVAQIKNAVDYADSLDNMSQRTGVAVETLSRLKVAAQLSDTSLESLQTGFVRLSKTQLEAQKGGQAQIALLQAFGLSVEEIGRLKPEDVLKRVADGFKDLKDPGMRAALAMEVFGKQGADLIPLLLQGSEGLAEFEKLSDQLGTTVSAETAAAAAEFNDQLDVLKLGFDGLFLQITAQLLPNIKDLAGSFNDPAFREGFAAIIEGAATAVVKVVQLIAELGNLTKFVGEELAARINGPSADDIVRLEQQRDRLKSELDGIVIDVPALISSTGVGRRAELAAEIAGVEQQIKDFYARQEEAARAAAAAGVVPPAGGPAVQGGNPQADALKRYLDALKAAQAGADGQRLAEREGRQIDKAIEAQERKIAGLLAEARTLGLTTAEREKAIAVADLEASILAKRPEELARLKAALEDAYDVRRAAQFQQTLRDTTEALDDEIEAMRLETDQIGMSTLEVQLSNIARQYSLELRRLSKDATDEEREALEKLIEAKRQEAEAEARRRDAMKGDWLGGARKGLRDYYDSVRDVFGSMQQFISGSLQKAEDALVEFFSTGKLNLKAFVADILKELLRIWVRAMIMKPILDWLGVKFPALGARALGGAVAAGGAYIVGENGPEIFTPAQSGRITPNNRMGQMMGGGPVTVHVNVSSDGQATTTGPDNDASRLGKLIGAKVREVIVQERRLGGLLAPAPAR